MLQRAAFVVFLGSSALAALAFTIFQGGPQVRGAHWAHGPMVAFAILFSMGCLVVLTSVATGRRR